MVEANAVEYLNEKHKLAAWLCGDENRKGCGLNGKLVDLGCNGCLYKAGQMGRGCISKEAKIHYNPEWPNSDFIEGEHLEEYFRKE